jgi:hypothetical protein
MDSQPDRMPGVEAAGWAVSRVTTRRPFNGVVIKWRRVESHRGEGVRDCAGTTVTMVVK